MEVKEGLPVYLVDLLDGAAGDRTRVRKRMTYLSIGSFIRRNLSAPKDLTEDSNLGPYQGRILLTGGEGGFSAWIALPLSYEAGKRSEDLFPGYLRTTSDP